MYLHSNLPVFENKELMFPSQFLQIFSRVVREIFQHVNVCFQHADEGTNFISQLKNIQDEKIF